MKSPWARSAMRAPSRSSWGEGRTTMPAAAWFTLIVSALIVAITAVGLVRVIFHLRAIRATLVATTGGVQADADPTTTPPDRLPPAHPTPTPTPHSLQPVAGA